MKALFRLAYRLYRLHWWITRPTTLGVRIILVQDEQLLLVRHSYQSQWFFPGGASKRRETLVDAAQREALEETGVRCLTTPRLQGIYLNLYEGKNDHIAVFVCEQFEQGVATDRWEIAACQFFPVTALPADFSPGCARRFQEYQSGAGPFAGKW
jgi:8-oxo-dGTP pyrophosphatase MutT (NUDIX family)